MRSSEPPVGEWQDRSALWPDWGDGGRQVEVEYDDGTVVRGKLDLYEMTPGPDEAPVFRVVDSAGAQHSWEDHKRWRYLT